jgi:metal-responsive CopG/Arc/MetJ family transcriptional regulator
MKTAVSIPDDVFDQVERLARKARKSRSEVFSAALREYIARHAPDEVTAGIDDVCARLATEDDSFATRAGRRRLVQSEW